MARLVSTVSLSLPFSASETLTMEAKQKFSSCYKLYWWIFSTLFRENQLLAYIQDKKLPFQQPSFIHPIVQVAVYFLLIGAVIAI